MKSLVRVQHLTFGEHSMHTPKCSQRFVYKASLNFFSHFVVVIVFQIGKLSPNDGFSNASALKTVSFNMIKSCIFSFFSSVLLSA